MAANAAMAISPETSRLTIRDERTAREPERIRPDHRSHAVLSGRSLSAARTAWLAVAAATAALFVVALPTRYAGLVGTIANLTPAQQLVLADLGISGVQQARLVFAVEALVAAVFYGVGLLIFARRSDDWLALLVSLTQITYVAWADPPLHALAVAQPAWLIPVTLIQALGMVSSTATLLLFPSGRFVPRWSRFLLVGAILWAVAWLLFPTSAVSLGDPYRLSPATFGAMLACYLGGIAVQIYRHAREARAGQRRQTRLVVFGETVAVLAYLTFGFDRFALPVVVGPFHAGIVYDLVGVPIFLLFATLIPTTLAVSILRYRLMEIEVIVSQALVYGTLTAIVAGLFPATMATLQRVFVALTGETSDVAAIVMTLFFAASLTPLKDLLQRLVDHAVKPASEPLASLDELARRARALLEVLDVELVARRALDEVIRSFDATGGAVYLADARTAPPLVVRGDWTQVEGITAEIEDRGRRFGWIALGPRHGGHPYHPRDEESLAEVGRGLARVIRLDRMIRLDVTADRPGASEEALEGARR